MLLIKHSNFNNLWGLCIVAAVIMILEMLKQIHIIQLNSYNLDQQILWYKKNKKSFVENFVLFAITLFSFFSHLFAKPRFKLHFPSTGEIIFSIVIVLLVLILLLRILISNFPHKQKKKLVFTNRIKRLIALCLLLFILWLYFSLEIVRGVDFSVDFIFMGIAISPFLVYIAYRISLPIENGIRQKFMNEAHDIIKRNDNLYVIGVTGSFGKTSVKHFLCSILREKYAVCMTPESYNTPMGATLTIKNDLKNIDDIFICEMGARRTHDIKEICDIVEPDGAIITDVGNMHLDTFKNIENVLNTKFELFDYAIKNEFENKKFNYGVVLLNGDNKLIREKYNEYRLDNNNKKVYFYGTNNDNDFYASEIKYSDKGASFTFNSNVKDYPTFKVYTKLLGYYNVINLVSAIAYAFTLNIDKDTICSAVSKIDSVEHRLKLLNYNKDTIIIDDAYNANLNGAKNACDVISKFDGFVKIIITPGMVELGDKQMEENESFAEYASGLVDYAIVVGNTNKLSLDKGFSKKLDNDRLIDVDSVEVAIAYALQNINGKKVILLENDLSDNY